MLHYILVLIFNTIMRPVYEIHSYFFLSEEARRALLQKIKSDGMSEDDVTKLMSVFDNQGKTKQIHM